MKYINTDTDYNVYYKIIDIDGYSFIFFSTEQNILEDGINAIYPSCYNSINDASKKFIEFCKDYKSKY